MARVMIRSYHADVSMSIEVLRHDKRRERGMLR